MKGLLLIIYYLLYAFFFIMLIAISIPIGYAIIQLIIAFFDIMFCDATGKTYEAF